MRLIRNLAIVLGASWFFPISCTTGVFVGTFVMAKLDEREVIKGDEVHLLFKIVIEFGENGKTFYPVSISELPDLRNRIKVGSFLMTMPSGEMDSGFYLMRGFT